MTIRIHIDNQPITTHNAANLIDIAADHGVYIPTLCYQSGKPCLGTCLGTCRVCSVRVNGAVMAACTVAVSDGMQITVNQPALNDMRKALVELLFSEGNHNCPACVKSGSCDLQAVGYEVGMTVSRFPYRFAPRQPAHAANTLWLERDRCIFCQRCVALIRDRNSGRKIFSIDGRSSQARNSNRQQMCPTS